ncbi:MAG: hypothetical protein RPR97_17530 [Colwellia sp.]
MLKILITIALLIVSNQASAISKCEREWNDLKSIQSQMRHRSTEYLRDKERDKHKEYQSCRKDKNKKSKSYKTKTKHKNPKTTYKSHSYPRYSSNNIKYSGSIKGKFKGEKQKAWLKHYRTPQECISPKNISKFSRCLSYRDEEAEKFTVQWNNKQ